MGDAPHQSFDEMTQPEITGQLILDLFKIVVRYFNRLIVLCALIATLSHTCCSGFTEPRNWTLLVTRPQKIVILTLQVVRKQKYYLIPLQTNKRL